MYISFIIIHICCYTLVNKSYMIHIYIYIYTDDDDDDNVDNIYDNNLIITI